MPLAEISLPRNEFLAFSNNLLHFSKFCRLSNLIIGPIKSIINQAALVFEETVILMVTFFGRTVVFYFCKPQ